MGLSGWGTEQSWAELMGTLRLFFSLSLWGRTDIRVESWGLCEEMI